jgi:hypothetical protein
MPMQAPAFVAVWHVGQAVGGFECKFLEDFHSIFQLGQVSGRRRV